MCVGVNERTSARACMCVSEAERETERRGQASALGRSNGM
jgi:hypothetical protein